MLLAQAIADHTVIVRSGVGFDTILAIVCSCERNRSIL